MGIFFGTDGIRGVACEELTYELAYKCGNALGQFKPKAKIIIGRDTRTSGTYLTNAFSGGVMSAGASVIDIGICTTPGIAYITKYLKADFGVVISASHNPAKYNGIKIFTSEGFKLDDGMEDSLERLFMKELNVSCLEIGTYEQNFELVDLYFNHLKKCCGVSLKGLKVVIDASNGASYKISPKIFKALGAEVICLNTKNDGANINNNCGSLHPETLSLEVIKNKADMGFAFDGDADRIIACDKNGRLIDGDEINYILAKYLYENGKLIDNAVVGTKHTNMAIEQKLNQMGIKFIRTDIGDKYVIERMERDSLVLGGEKSGHIILREYATTGDGILTALIISKIVKEKGLNINELIDVKLFPQCNIDVVVRNKNLILENKQLISVIQNKEQELGNLGRIMVRASGTEPKIRIMVEGENGEVCEKLAKEIEVEIKRISGGLCVE